MHPLGDEGVQAGGKVNAARFHREVQIEQMAVEGVELGKTEVGRLGSQFGLDKWGQTGEGAGQLVPDVEGLARLDEESDLPGDHVERVLGVVILEQGMKMGYSAAGIPGAEGIDHGEDVGVGVERGKPLYIGPGDRALSLKVIEELGEFPVGEAGIAVDHLGQGRGRVVVEGAFQASGAVLEPTQEGGAARSLERLTQDSVGDAGRPCTQGRVSAVQLVGRSPALLGAAADFVEIEFFEEDERGRRRGGLGDGGEALVPIRMPGELVGGGDGHDAARGKEGKGVAGPGQLLEVERSARESGEIEVRRRGVAEFAPHLNDGLGLGELVVAEEEIDARGRSGHAPTRSAAEFILG